MIPSPANITKLAPKEVFVFGANEAGIHGKGAALQARKWGAIIGKVGYMGQTYGLPTKDIYLKPLKLNEIKYYIEEFLDFARTKPELIFLMTAIGTGLAEYSIEEIALLFPQNLPNNVRLPQVFIENRKNNGIIDN